MNRREGRERESGCRQQAAYTNKRTEAQLCLTRFVSHIQQAHHSQTRTKLSTNLTARPCAPRAYRESRMILSSLNKIDFQYVSANFPRKKCFFVRTIQFNDLNTLAMTVLKLFKLVKTVFLQDTTFLTILCSGFESEQVDTSKNMYPFFLTLFHTVFLGFFWCSDFLLVAPHLSLSRVIDTSISAGFTFACTGSLVLVLGTDGFSASGCDAGFEPGSFSNADIPNDIS